ncbi:hypothetical protein GJA14_00860 [Limosilactobacillus fermentum]|nr:hypothetical protein GJA14_00860 [Limosilactobacillus fermentum]
MSKGKLIVETLIDLLRAVRAFRNLPVSALTKIAQIASPPTTYQAEELISDGQGEQALFVRQPRLARLIEAVYPTTVIRLRHDAFQDLLASSPLLARELLNSFGARLA